MPSTPAQRLGATGRLESGAWWPLLDGLAASRFEREWSIMIDDARQETERPRDERGVRPTISVVTPSFDQRDFVDATLRSVVGQGYNPLEYVVIDGGSTDDSADIIARFDEHLAYWVSEPDNGHAHAVNKGFAHTSGEIMCWLNSSDMHYPWTLETVSQVFRDLPEVEWIMGLPTQFHDSTGPKSVQRDVFNVYDFLAGNYHAVQQESVFWRRSLWERAGGALNADLRFAADFDLWLRFFSLARLHHVDTVLGGFRVHGDRLGAYERYARQAQRLITAFASQQDRQTLLRARLVRATGAGHGRNQLLAKALDKLGVCPWYRHPRVVFDFARRRWTVA